MYPLDRLSLVRSLPPEQPELSLYRMVRRLYAGIGLQLLRVAPPSALALFVFELLREEDDDDEDT